MPLTAEEKLARIKSMNSSGPTVADKLSAIKDYEQRKAQASLEESTSKFVDQTFIEDRLGGKLETGKEIPNFYLNMGVGNREELGRKVDFVNNSGVLPQGAQAYGVLDRHGSPVLAYRLPGDKTFYHINDPGASKADIGEVAGALASFETAVGIAAEFGNPAKKLQAASKLGRAGIQAGRYAWDALAAGGGRMLDEYTEGFSDEDFQSMAAITDKGIESAAFGAAGAGAGDLVSGGVNRMAGRHTAAQMRPEDAARLRVIEDQYSEEWGRLGAGDMGNPVGQRAQRQAAAMMESDAAREAQKLQGPAESLVRRHEQLKTQVSTLDDAEIDELVENERKAATALFKNKLGKDFKRTSPEDAGQAALEAVEGYKVATSAQADINYSKVYDSAQEAGLRFDVSDVIDQAREETQSLLLEGRRLQNQRRMVEVDRPLDAQLDKILTQFREVADIQGPDQLQALRTLDRDLRLLSEPAPGTLTRTPSQAAAVRVRAALSEALRNPVGGDSAAYRKALKTADSAWQQRQKDLGALSFVSRYQDQTGSGELMYRDLTSGRMTMESAKLMKRVMSAKDKQQFEAAFYTDLLQDPANAHRRIMQQGEKIRLFIDDDAVEAARILERNMNRIEQGTLTRMVGTTERHAGEVRQLIEDGSPQAMRAIKATGGKRAVSEAVTNSLIKDAVDIVKGRPVLNPTKYHAVMKRYREKGVLDLVDRGTRSLIEDVDFFSSFLSTASTSGDSIAAAGRVSELFKVATNPGAAGTAGLAIWQTHVAAKMAHSKQVRDVIMGAGKAPKPHNGLKAATLATALFLDQYVYVQELTQADIDNRLQG